MKLLYKLLLLLVVSGLLFACGTEEQTQSELESEQEQKQEQKQKQKQKQLQVYTTLYPLEYFANEIGGAYVDVISILPAGADPHTYEPTSKTMVDIATADAFIYNGANLETYAEKIQAALSEENVKMVEATEGIDLLNTIHAHEEEAVHVSTEESNDHDHEDEGHDEEEHAEAEEHIEDDGHNHGDVDPHVWLDPILAQELAENVKNTLVGLMPEQKETFETNYQDLILRLNDLDAEFHETIESYEQNKILVSHAGYGYWEKAYGLEQIAISGLSSSNEPSQKELERIIEAVRENNIEYLFFEQNITPKVATVIQNEAGIESLELHNLSVLTEQDIENGDDYFTLMERNLKAIETALSE
ncbi:adhesin [Paraliobacillus quinghaiensis]|uniref:Adhesin n=1 Tax=Paraliobacillus quinghaiensis TaxID=470815 RepID=A0A917WT11_9BACI|nr:zinc ABC transporter substrate-binding protein [Paraliobacillus quinghaiensis]GGM25734.1 adhesin [Paraliobacillus quinghaiensis]